MITLNLLPPSKKQERRLTQVYILIKNLIILILFLTSIAAIVLLLSKMTLQNHFNRIVEETTLTTRYAGIFNNDIKKFNQHLEAVEKIQEEYIFWSNFFIDFSKIIPDGIIIYSLNIKKDRILITGLANTRDQLLKLEKNLKNSSLFFEVVIPLENLLTKENIDFDIKADINMDNLKTKKL